MTKPEAINLINKTAMGEDFRTLWLAIIEKLPWPAVVSSK